ncbi:conserved hypothetical protein [Ricinus communis]|uniref:Uncharacterized protein n=1 Tax=Ricinus communis TaxID=3988 RepID=B9T1N7_RICCO|nr:conserved hypothetical protein [Ricinus communis]
MAEIALVGDGIGRGGLARERIVVVREKCQVMVAAIAGGEEGSDVAKRECCKEKAVGEWLPRVCLPWKFISVGQWRRIWRENYKVGF